MKENDIVTLINNRPKYKKHNLYEGANGIILKSLTLNKNLVLFLNDNIVGDYAVAEIDDSDLRKEAAEIPFDFIKELKNTEKLNKENLYNKNSFKMLTFKECDPVELIAEDEKYSKYNIHKGAKGVIAIDYAVQNSVLVDFSDVDENGNCFGDIITVNIKDLKILK